MTIGNKFLLNTLEIGIKSNIVYLEKALLIFLRNTAKNQDITGGY